MQGECVRILRRQLSPEHPFKIPLPLTHQMVKDDRRLYLYYQRAILTKLISCRTTVLPMSSEISGSLGLTTTLILPTQGKNVYRSHARCIYKAGVYSPV